VLGAVFGVRRSPDVGHLASRPPVTEKAQAPPAPAPAAHVPAAPPPAAAPTPAPAPAPPVVARGEDPGATVSKADATLAPVQPASPVPPTPPAVEGPPIALAPAITLKPSPAPPEYLNRRERRRARALHEPVEAAEGEAAEAPVESHAASLRIELLVWAADPEKRMVYLNGRKFVEGEAVEAGTVIEQILEDGVVLLRQGQRIRLPAEAR
jgi:Type II secretion system protein B